MTIEESLTSIAESLAALVALQKTSGAPSEVVASVPEPAPEPKAAKKKRAKAASAETPVDAEVVAESTITIADVRTVAAQLLDKVGGQTAFTTIMNAAGLAKLSDAKDADLANLFSQISAKLEEKE